MSEEVTFKCEVCGNPAVDLVHDMAEVMRENVATWAVAATHLYCRNHYRPATIKHLDGKTYPGTTYGSGCCG